MSIEIAASLKELRLFTVSEKYIEVAQKCSVEKVSHLEYLRRLVDMEIEQRYHKKIKRLMKQSRIPRRKSIADFNTERLPHITKDTVNNLVRGEFIDRAGNLLIFGNPGTGKTHLVIALTQEWCSGGRKVLFISAAELVQDLIKAKSDMTWNQKIGALNKYDVLVIDDISYVPCDDRESDLLFILLASRYENKSVVITSNLAFDQWNTIFKDDMTTVAAIDRLVHHSIILKLNADSYRKEAAKLNQINNQEGAMET